MRYNWAAEYRGKATVVYGHTPVPEPEWLNNTVNIDTGAVFGGALLGTWLGVERLPRAALLRTLGAVLGIAGAKLLFT